MSSGPEGMATEGLPVGPEMKEKSQVGAGQPGLQAELVSKPVDTALPTQHGGEGVLTLEEYRGVGKLRGKVALITGGDSGIGRAVAVMMAKEGARAVAIVYVEREQRDAGGTRQLVEEEGAQAMPLPCDIGRGEAACKRLVDEVVGKHGKLDILVNNAAVQYTTPTIEETTPDKLEHSFRVNLFPHFYLAKAAVPHMPRGSSIIGSASVVAYQGSAQLLEYSATKGAIVALTRSLAKALAPAGIRVNAVAPGPVHTPLNPASRTQENLEQWMESKPPLGRICQPSEIGPSYIFLASQESTAYTGQVLHPNGGYVING